MSRFAALVLLSASQAAQAHWSDVMGPKDARSYLEMEDNDRRRAAYHEREEEEEEHYYS